MSVKHWQLQEAKNRFSEVVALAIKDGAQTVTKHGKPAVIIVSVEEYQRNITPRKTLFQALRECPEALSPLVGTRLRDRPRDIRFE
ncbi:MAG: type II toxin-antitoxin system Phd/YefM family antitoxin [Verrucomicrobiota bacterium]